MREPMKDEAGRLPTTSRRAILAAHQVMLNHVHPEEIPADEDLVSGPALEAYLASAEPLGLSLLAGGDVMLGGRARKAIEKYGPEYPFEGVAPLLRQAPIVLANLEGPLAKYAEKQDRHFSYRVHPRTASTLKRAGINVVNLANNHLLDCGVEGVLETLEALATAGVLAIGGGENELAAHAPVILEAGPYRIGLLGYYWNRRTAATSTRPGSAMDTPDDLVRDIRALRGRADRIVVTVHWGLPYEAEPTAEDRAKARFAIDCGADAVIGHHSHVIQPIELHRGRPIIYSLGNFAFGSANSRAESMLLGIRFEERRTVLHLYPTYVKNRDLRAHYQPKLLRGAASARLLTRLADRSGLHDLLHIDDLGGTLELPSPGTRDGHGDGLHG